MPFDRAQRKKEVGQGMALLLESCAMYDGKPIPPNYARVDVTWMNPDFDEDEINIPTEEGTSSST